MRIVRIVLGLYSLALIGFWWFGLWRQLMANQDAIIEGDTVGVRILLWIPVLVMSVLYLIKK